MSEPTDTRARAIALLHDLVDPQRNGGNVPPRSEISEARIVAFIRAERQAVWEEAAKEVEVHALHAEATSNQQALQMADDICATLRQRVAAEGQEPTP